MDRIMIQRIYNDHILNKKSNNEYKNVIVNGGNTVGLYAAFLLFIGNLLLMVVKFRVAPRPRSPTPLSNDFFRILSAPKEFENPVLRLRGRRRTLITLDDQTSPLSHLHKSTTNILVHLDHPISIKFQPKSLKSRNITFNLLRSIDILLNHSNLSLSPLFPSDPLIKLRMK